MRKILSVLFLLVASLASAASQPLANYYNSVAEVYGNRKVGEPLHFICSTTAFEKTKTGFLFVTASHCITENPEGVTLYVGDDKPNGERYPAAVLAVGDQEKLYDFAVLYVTAPAKAFSVTPLGHDPKQFGEHVYSFSSPLGVGKAYTEGYVSLLNIQSDPVSRKARSMVSWNGNIGLMEPGMNKGSSGSSIVCRSQQAICGIMIGMEALMVMEPISRFEQWWSDVKVGKIEHIVKFVPLNPQPQPQSVPQHRPMRRTLPRKKLR